MFVTRLKSAEEIFMVSLWSNWKNGFYYWIFWSSDRQILGSFQRFQSESLIFPISDSCWQALIRAIPTKSGGDKMADSLLLQPSLPLAVNNIATFQKWKSNTKFLTMGVPLCGCCIHAKRDLFLSLCLPGSWMVLLQHFPIFGVFCRHSPGRRER